ncbi:hypothetical protein [Pseudomonas putida]|uniref:Lipoprotein n=1 Tax=Pseudomonas putida TaxID=303 RepID=A0A8I1EC17_PSEPU|nr:hypothetical protein [Pseudomonas putida]MBI6882901.1 hypothetical protein [Pseudomonas putida]
MKSKLIVLLFSLLFSSLSMAAGVACLKIQNYDDPTGKKQQQIESGFSALEDPHMDLLGCFSNVKDNGIDLMAASKECSCKEALKKLCKFSKKKGKFTGDGFDQAACMTFRPILWPRMLI